MEPNLVGMKYEVWKDLLFYKCIVWVGKIMPRVFQGDVRLGHVKT